MKTMEFIITDDLVRRNVTIYGFYKIGNHDVIIGFDGKHIVETTIPEAELLDENTISPLLKMPRNMFEELVKCLAEYAETRNIKTESKDFNRGKLDVTEAHLSTINSHYEGLTDIIRNLISKLPKA